METLRHDLRYGMRMLIKNPGFTAGVALSLALGIGLNTAIFSLVNALLLRPLPGVEQPDNLIGIYDTRQGSGYFNVSYPDYLYYRERSQSFSDIVAHWPTPFALSSSGDPVKVDGAIVSGNYFPTLGLKPVRGRFFLPEEDRTPDAHPVAVISYSLWHRHFNSDPDLIGKTVTLNGHGFTVIGIAPAGFTGTLTGLAAELWVPLMMQAVALPGTNELIRGQNMLYLMAIGRLKPGMGLKQAQAEMSIHARQLEDQYPETNKERGVVLAPVSGVHPVLRGVISAFLGILMAVVIIVLLIACANVTNLLLAKAIARRREIAIRLSLGASRRRLIQQLLTESMLLALAGGVVGLLIAVWSINLLLSLMPPTGLPFSLNLSPDVRVLGFSLLLSLLTGTVFGLAPALQATNPNLVQALKDEVAVGSYSQSCLRNILVIAQIALSLVLLIGAGLLVRSLRNAQRIDLGFNPEKLLIVSFDTTLLNYDEAKSETFYRELLRRVVSVPGVQRASVARFIPLGPAGDSVPVIVEGQEPRPGQEGSPIGYNL
ncbi:MAG: ABC transporter permease, partial [Acidobacteria bacterium]|nr:ABC transporter permease [Acidobacteriota bacterium]